MNQGVIRAVKDLVVTFVFDEDYPELYEVLAVDDLDTPLLVDSLEEGGKAICLNINSDRRLQKGMKVQRTHKSIEIPVGEDRKSTRLNSSHSQISYAVFCLKKKKN